MAKQILNIKHSKLEVEGDLQVRNDPEIKRVQVPQINLCTVYSKAYD